MNLLENALIAIAVLSLILYKQVQAERIDERRMFTLPTVLLIVGLGEGGLVDRAHPAVGGALLAAGIVLALAGGGLRAATVRVWRDGTGSLWRRGGAWTVAVWLLSLAARAGVIALGYAAGVRPGAGDILVFLGLSLLVQNLVVLWRARRVDGIAPVSVVS